MSAINIKVDCDSLGCLILTPVSDKIRVKIMYYLKSMGVQSEGTALLQGDTEIEHFKEEYMPAQKAKDLSRGWEQRIRIDAWMFCHFFGWDTHLLAETGELWK